MAKRTLETDAKSELKLRGKISKLEKKIKKLEEKNEEMAAFINNQHLLLEKTVGAVQKITELLVKKAKKSPKS